MTSADSTRTSKRTQFFRRPFQIGKDDEVFPAGPYEILTREAVHEGNERTVYVRISTTLLVKSMGSTRHCEVRPADLEEAIRLDGRMARHPGGAS
jgi:hypothetical protein